MTALSAWLAVPEVLAQVPSGWEWLQLNTDQIWRRGIEHLQLTGIAIGFGLVISIILSVIALRYRPAFRPITLAAGVAFTIPSIALFPALVPYTGLTVTTATIGLTLYTLLILVRNIIAGIEGVPAEVVEAAQGMGYRRNRLFLEVELPLALPVIIAGIRIATVTTIGLVTITGLIGYGGFGFFIFDGLRSNFYVPKLLVGALAPMAMSLLADAILQLVERALTPWSRRAATV